MVAARFATYLAVCLAAAVSATDEAGLKFMEAHLAEEGTVRLPSGVQYRVLATGDPEGLTPNATTNCDVHFVGTLIDGTEVDSSRKKSYPAKFPPENALPGWREAMLLMREGDKWDVVLPSELAYGEKGGGRAIPPNSVLRLELELLKVYPEVDITFFDRVNEMYQDKPMLAILLPMCVYFIFKMRGIDVIENFMLMFGLKRNKVVELKDARKHEDNVTVFIDCVFGSEKGRIEMLLFAGHFPKTCENFQALISGTKLGESASSEGDAAHFKGSTIHRVVPGLCLQGGKLLTDKGESRSAFGGPMELEWDAGVISHEKEGLLSMVVQEEGTSCSSQFLITLKRSDHWDRRHAFCFGQITAGMAVVRKIENLGTKEGKTKKDVKIVDCGELKKTAKAKPVADKKGAEKKTD